MYNHFQLTSKNIYCKTFPVFKVFLNYNNDTVKISILHIEHLLNRNVSPVMVDYFRIFEYVIINIEPSFMIKDNNHPSQCNKTPVGVMVALTNR